MCAYSGSRIGRSVPEDRCRTLREVRKPWTSLRSYRDGVGVMSEPGGCQCGGWQLRWAGVVVSLRYCKTCPSPCASIIVRGNDVAIFNFPYRKLQPYNRLHGI